MLDSTWIGDHLWLGEACRYVIATGVDSFLYTLWTVNEYQLLYEYQLFVWSNTIIINADGRYDLLAPYIGGLVA